LVQLQRLAIAPQQQNDGEIVLTPPQQHYLSRVLRLRKGDRFIAMDGRGNWWLSELEASLTQAKIIESLCVQTELLGAVTLMAAMPKGNGFDEVVYQATELGVAGIIPVKSDRTLLNPSPQKVERWRRLTKEAAEQSERQIVPTVFDPVDFTASLQLTATPDAHRYICVARGEAPYLLNCLSEQPLNLETTSSPSTQRVWSKPVGDGEDKRDKEDKEESSFQPTTDDHTRTQASVVIATGPEGGWTEAEVEQATAAGFQAVSLGRRILRAVTAPIVALSLVTSVFELS
jgi:16S rRNA (uracil1498-N3)-methyltransferase